MEFADSEPREIETIPLKTDQFVKHAAISPDATMCALCTGYYSDKNQELEKLEVYSLDPFEKVKEFTIGRRVNALKFSSDSQKLLTVIHNRFSVYDLQSGHREKVFNSQEDYNGLMENQIFTDSLWSVEGSYEYGLTLKLFKNSSKACKLLLTQRAARSACSVSSDGKHFRFFPEQGTFAIFDIDSKTIIKQFKFTKNLGVGRIALTNQLSIFPTWKKITITDHSKRRRNQWIEKCKDGSIEFILSTDEQILLLKNGNNTSILDLQSFPPRKIGSIDYLQASKLYNRALLTCDNNIVIGNSIVGDEHDDNERHSAVTIFDISSARHFSRK